MRLGLGISLTRGAFVGGLDQDIFAVVLDTNLRTGSTTVLIPVNAKTGGDRTIDWGDGVVETQNGANPTHIYATDGVYTVKMYGGTTTRLGNTGSSPDDGWTKTLTRVLTWGKTIGWTSFESGLRSCTQNVLVPNEIPRTSDGYAANVANMQSMFQNATAFNQPIGSWNTAAVTTMAFMFAGATAFNQPIGSWNTAAVTGMRGLFISATAFNQPIGSWNTAAVTDMNSMFQNATAFNQPIGSWNTAAVTTMAFMFDGATAFNQPIGSWNTAAVTTMAFMFAGATAFNQNIGGWNTAAVTTMASMFSNATAFNQPIGSWNTAAVTGMRGLFINATSFNQPIGSWNTAEVTDMTFMFISATAFNQPIGSWNTAKVASMASMFDGATAFNQNIGGWTLRTAGVTMTSMLNSCGMNAENYSRTLIGWANRVSAASNLPSAVALGATGRTYNSTNYGGTTYTDAVAARAYLVGAAPNPAWTISGDSQV